jgi:uncharacterized protein (DUF2252 family)
MDGKRVALRVRWCQGTFFGEGIAMNTAEDRKRTPSWRRAHLSEQERKARGKAARAASPRSSHGVWAPAPDRPDPISLLEEQAVSRVPDLVPIRYGRMLVSPGTFYRGAALIMASDLAGTPDSGVRVQLCGDAHLSNFGLFASPERQMIFDINDFDETLPGPWEWDVKRLAASFEVAGRDLGFSPADRRAIVTAGVRAYRERMRESATMGTLDCWYAHTNVDEVIAWMDTAKSEKRLGKKDEKGAERQIAKARTRNSVRVFSKRTGEVQGELRIVRDPPLIVPIEDLVLSPIERAETEKEVAQLIRTYRRGQGREHHPIEEFIYVHMARKVVGVGSVGTRCWIFLMEGRDLDDPLFLQAKEAQASVLERFVGKSEYTNHGQRVVAGQHLMQAATDIFLGWQRFTDRQKVTRDYYIRQFQDWKGSVDVDRLSVPGATFYARICGEALGRAHARWGDRIAIASYLGGGDAFDTAIADFSAAYADQNQRDYEALAKAVKSGRLPARSGL